MIELIIILIISIFSILLNLDIPLSAIPFLIIISLRVIFSDLEDYYNRN